jgi:hypothetical protein
MYVANAFSEYRYHLSQIKYIVAKLITLQIITLHSQKLFFSCFVKYLPLRKKFKIKIADFNDMYILLCSLPSSLYDNPFLRTIRPIKFDLNFV